MYSKINMTELTSTLLRHYTPIFVFHEDESYWPTDPYTYIASSSLLIDSTLEEISQKGKINPLLMDTAPLSHSGTTLNMEDEKIQKMGYDPNTKVIGHVHQEDGMIYLQYVPFYSYNGPVKLFKCIELKKHKIGGSHQADIENVIVAINRETLSVEKVYLSQHGDHVAYNFEDLDVSDSRIRIYVAYHAHANYPRQGAYQRFFGVTADYCGNGQIWKPEVFEIFDKQHALYNPHTMAFSQYGGNWGRGRVTSFKDQTFWSNKPNNVKQSVWP